MRRRKIKIIGIGNPLMGDDGAGVAAIERLRQHHLPEGVELIDAGTGGLALLYLMEGVDKVIFLDAVEMGQAPGTVRRFPAEELATAGEGGSGLSLHATGLLEVLALARQMGPNPEVVLMGIQPESVAWGLGLSQTVSRALGRLTGRLEREFD